MTDDGIRPIDDSSEARERAVAFLWGPARDMLIQWIDDGGMDGWHEKCADIRFPWSGFGSGGYTVGPPKGGAPST